MKAPVSVLLVGVGGYGNTYVNALLDADTPAKFRIVGIVDPYPEGCIRLGELTAKNIPLYSHLEEFYAASYADLAIISTPIYLHAFQSIYCLEQGSHVICEKPAAALIQDVRAMEAAAKSAGRMLTIAFQWSFSDAIQSLKEDIMEGVFGPARRLRTLVQWPRDDAYYARGWAGKVRTDTGQWVLDSVANNAAAHYLHNMLYVLGRSRETSVDVDEIEAEVYRARAIENYDTAAIRVMTHSGVELLFFATHATQTSQEPTFLFEFENGTVRFGQQLDGTYQQRISGLLADGSLRDYGNPNAERSWHLWQMLDAIATGRITDLCGPTAAGVHTMCINAVQENFPQVPRFPEQLIHYDEDEQRYWVEGLSADFQSCYAQGKLPSESGCSWSQPKIRQSLQNYREFGRA